VVAFIFLLFTNFLLILIDEWLKREQFIFCGWSIFRAADFFIYLWPDIIIELPFKWVMAFLLPFIAQNKLKYS
jgi:hypothetical protein